MAIVWSYNIAYIYNLLTMNGRKCLGFVALEAYYMYLTSVHKFLAWITVEQYSSFSWSKMAQFQAYRTSLPNYHAGIYTYVARIKYDTYLILCNFKANKQL